MHNDSGVARAYLVSIQQSKCRHANAGCGRKQLHPVSVISVTRARQCMQTKIVFARFVADDQATAFMQASGVQHCDQ